MSKIFSIIGLETNTGIRDAGIMSGIPEVDDIQRSIYTRSFLRTVVHPSTSP